METKLKQLHPLITFTKESWRSSVSLWEDAAADWEPSRDLQVSDYQPLDVFGVKAEDPGPASWIEADGILTLLIKLKETELFRMMEETPRSVKQH